MKVLKKWKVSVLLAAALLAGTIIVLRSNNNEAKPARMWPFAAHPLSISLLSNQEIAGLEFAWFVVSNRTDRSVRYLRDPKADQPWYALAERSATNPITGAVTITNHNQHRVAYIKPAELPPHMSVPLTVRYPSDVTGAVLMVSYWPARTRLQWSLYKIRQFALGIPAPPADAYEAIRLSQPFGRPKP